MKGKRKERIIKHGYKLVSIVYDEGVKIYLSMMGRIFYNSGQDCSAIRARRYYIDKWTQPHKDGGALTVFDNITDAEAFLKRLRILESITERATSFLIHPCLYVPTERPIQSRGKPCLFRVPPGTAKAAFVKLVTES